MGDFVTIDKIEKNGDILEFNELKTERGSLYSVRIYTYNLTKDYFTGKQRNFFKMIKCTDILYSFGEAYTIFKKWNKSF
jgi:hypothetical protein